MPLVASEWPFPGVVLYGRIGRVYDSEASDVDILVSVRRQVKTFQILQQQEECEFQGATFKIRYLVPTTDYSIPTSNCHTDFSSVGCYYYVGK